MAVDIKAKFGDFVKAFEEAKKNKNELVIDHTSFLPL